jgi:hypothetical protein
MLRVLQLRGKGRFQERFVPVDQDGRRGTRFCYPVESMNRTEGVKVSSELGVERDRRRMLN